MATYLAGPIAGCTDTEKHQWRELATERLGNVIDPTEWSENVVARDKEAIRRSEAVLAYCPYPSVGTSMEILYAHHIGKPVIAVVPKGEPISPWILAHTVAVCWEVGTACSLLRGILCST